MCFSASSIILPFVTHSPGWIGLKSPSSQAGTLAASWACRSSPPPLSSLCPHPAPARSLPWGGSSACSSLYPLGWSNAQKMSQTLLGVTQTHMVSLCSLDCLSCPLAGLPDLGNKNKNAQLYWNQFSFYRTNLYSKSICCSHEIWLGTPTLIWRPYLHDPGSPLLLEIWSLNSKTWRPGVAGMGSH